MPFGECCGDLHHGYCLILSFPGISEAEAVKQCGEALFEVQALLRKELGEAPFWGVSTPANSAGMLPELFQEANDLCRETGLTEDVPPKVAEAVRYLQEHFAENISLQSVADHLNITPNYLGHLFVRFLEIYEKYFSDLYLGIMQNSGSAIRLVDRDGEVLSSRKKEDLGKEYFSSEALPSQGTDGQFTDWDAGVQVLWVYMPSPRLWIVNEIGLNVYWKDLSNVVLTVLVTFLMGLTLLCIFFLL